MPNADTSATQILTDICVIGGGAAGLAAAIQAAAFGQRVVLIERHRLGGDSLNYGAAPARAMAQAAVKASQVRKASGWGIHAGEVRLEPVTLSDRLNDTLTSLGAEATVERLRGIGIRVLQASARFIDRETVAAGDELIKARRFIIATGASPKIPPVEGLASMTYFTSETVLAHRAPIPHLAVIGGGATGLALAQTYVRLGSQVTVLENKAAISEVEREFREPLLAALRAEGVTINEGFAAVRIVSAALGLSIESANARLECSHLVVACGRAPALAGLGLTEAGVRSGPNGISVNRALQTSNPKIYAIGEVTGRDNGTHLARADASFAVRHSLFRTSSRRPDAAIPRLVWTDPGFAEVGLNEATARAAGYSIRVLRWAFAQTDAGLIEGDAPGHIKVVTDARGRVLGASILGQDAHEKIGLWALATDQRMPITSMASLHLPYPSYSEAGVRAAQTAFSGVPSNPIARKIIALLAKLG